MTVQKVLIAGGGIGGLTAAAYLLQEGFDVEVYEQAKMLGEVGAGIQVSANASRVYRRIGILDDLIAAGYLPDQYRFRTFDEGAVLQTIPLGPQYIEKHEVPYISVHRADLHRLLVNRVQQLKPNAVTLNAEVTSFTQDDSGVTLLFKNGESAHGDLLVGADGIKSVIRKMVLGDTPVNYSGDSSWRVIVPMNSLPVAYQAQSVDIWVGPGKHAVTYPLRGGELMNLVACVEQQDQDEESWVTKRPWQELHNDFRGWHGAIEAIIQAADHDECYRWAMNNRFPVDNWSLGRVTLIGDAAHPTLPYMAQGAAMAVEDAAVLTRAIQQSRCAEDAVQLYQRNRIERTAKIVNESSDNRRLFHLESVAALQQAFAERDMKAERSAWLFSYDPTTVSLV